MADLKKGTTKKELKKVYYHKKLICFTHFFSCAKKQL